MEGIQSICIKNTETRQSPKPHVVYRVEVQAAVRTWTIWKRYSEFDELNDKLSRLFPNNLPPCEIPGKNYFQSTLGNPILIEERRRGLEEYLKAILSHRDDRWRETDEWKAFLAIPTGRSIDPINMYTFESWLDEFQQVQALAKEIRSHLNRRETHIAKNEVQASHNCSLQAKKCLATLGVRASQLESGLTGLAKGSGRDGKVMSEGELRRRQDMLNDLKDEKDTLAKLVLANRPDYSKATTPASSIDRAALFRQPIRQRSSPQLGKFGGSAIMDTPANGNGLATSPTSSILTNSQTNLSSRRVFGNARATPAETEQTRGLDNEGLVKLQKQAMEDQDRHVEQFTAILNRQKHIGLAINNELEIQNQLLTELDERRRRLYGTSDEQELQVTQNYSPEPNYPTGFSLKRSNDNDDDQQSDEREERRRKRRSRWGGEESKVNIPGLPTAITSKMSKEQLDAYLLHMRLEEIGRKLRTGDYVPPERERSLSPKPIYDSQGKRVNTREYRYRKKLEDERHRLIEDAIKMNPDFKPPADYKRPTKMQDKVYIPAREFPEINFIGLLIGPRGNTLKKMESESGAKISIRGKGSVKEGKSRTDSAANANQEEDLHCLVTADSEDKVEKAVEMVNKIIENSASVPEGQNELKRQQLRELAALNGTLRDDENQICANCGITGHRNYECTESQNVTINLTCRICSGHGHTARDCMERNNPEALQQAKQRDQRLDNEYLNLMAELGENIGSKTNETTGKTGHYGPATTSKPPWAQSNATSGTTTTHWASKSSTPTSTGVHTGLSSIPPWQQTASTTIPPPPGLSNAPPPPALSLNNTPWNTAKTTNTIYAPQPPQPPPPPGSLYPTAPAPTSTSYYSLTSTNTAPK
nr:12715_t:CDS:2 [Entrophospora candida]